MKTKKQNKMKKLQETKKITLATLKSFARRNNGKLYFKVKSSFSGMTDMCEDVNMGFEETEMNNNKGYYQTGIQGIYTVGGGGDYYKIYEDEMFYGIYVYNCCGTCILAVKKEVEYIDFEKELLEA